MENEDNLQNLQPNKLYSIHANLKYIHQTPKTITAIIQGANTQSKLCIRDNTLSLSPGWDYHFNKCFNSHNGWIYARNPRETIKRQNQVNTQQPLDLRTLINSKQEMLGHYVSLRVFLVEIAPQKVVTTKEGKQIKLIKLKCFGSGALINVMMWQRQIDQQFQNHWLVLDGFKFTLNGLDSLILNSSVYSKIQKTQNQPNQQYNHQIFYQNFSSFYKHRNILQLLSTAQHTPKLYSIIKSNIIQTSLYTYVGCIICKRKIEGVNCITCGGDVGPSNFTILKLKISDNDSFLYVSVFKEQIQKRIAEHQQNQKINLYIKTTPSKCELMLNHIVSYIE